MDKDLETIAPLAADFLDWLNDRGRNAPGTPPPRQRVLTVDVLTVDWAFRPLSPRQRRLLAESIADILHLHRAVATLRDRPENILNIRTADVSVPRLYLVD